MYSRAYGRKYNSRECSEAVVFVWLAWLRRESESRSDHKSQVLLLLVLSLTNCVVICHSHNSAHTLGSFCVTAVDSELVSNLCRRSLRMDL